MNNRRDVFWGIMFIAIATFILLNQFGLVDMVIGTGNIVLAIVFLATLIKSIMMLSFPGIFISLAFLWIIFDDYIGVPHISEVVVIFTAVLFAIGFSMIFPSTKRKMNYFSRDDRWSDYGDVDREGRHQKVVHDENDGKVFCSNRFGASAKYVDSRNLKSVRIENSFGELKVYFDNAIMDGNSVEISVSVSFGALELYIPKEWAAFNRVNALAASVKEANHGNPDGNHSVVLVGSVSFGELSVIYV
ncbi:MAG: hypothetical protein HFH14_01310 [Lachnospiraceae bacterium]|nr:hypothetical protein [Lachnospiraceae bacterium]